MANAKLNESPREATSTPRVLAAQAFSRAAGAPLVHGNRIRLLRDAEENYSAWLEAIRSASKTVHFENYIVRDDDIGQQFADALCARRHEVDRRAAVAGRIDVGNILPDDLQAALDANRTFAFGVVTAVVGKGRPNDRS